jgi:hypothetical protein
MTSQKHANRSLLAAFSGTLAAVLRGARTSLYQPLPAGPLAALPLSGARSISPPSPMAKIIEFPHPSEDSPATNRQPQPFLLPRKPALVFKVPNLAMAQPPQVGLR